MIAYCEMNGWPAFMHYQDWDLSPNEYFELAGSYGHGEKGICTGPCGYLDNGTCTGKQRSRRVDGLEIPFITTRVWNTLRPEIG